MEAAMRIRLFVMVQQSVVNGQETAQGIAEDQLKALQLSDLPELRLLSVIGPPARWKLLIGYKPSRPLTTVFKPLNEPAAYTPKRLQLWMNKTRTIASTLTTLRPTS